MLPHTRSARPRLGAAAAAHRAAMRSPQRALFNRGTCVRETLQTCLHAAPSHAQHPATTAKSDGAEQQLETKRRRHNLPPVIGRLTRYE
jgi:hypothetical protein